jgi:hypothetical protein
VAKIVSKIVSKINSIITQIWYVYNLIVLPTLSYKEAIKAAVVLSQVRDYMRALVLVVKASEIDFGKELPPFNYTIFDLLLQLYEADIYDYDQYQGCLEELWKEYLSRCTGSAPNIKSIEVETIDGPYQVIF